jgi:hypothetical protein
MPCNLAHMCAALRAPAPKENFMRKLLSVLLASLLCASPALANGLQDFLNHVNIQAQADLSHFSAQVSTQFGVPQAQVRVVLGQVSSPADAFMVFQLGQMSGRPPNEVMQVYQDNRGRGWGVIAQRLGIRPGSRAFHALKRGDLRFGGGYGGDGYGGGGPGNGRGGPPFGDGGPGRGHGRPF